MDASSPTNYGRWGTPSDGRRYDGGDCPFYSTNRVSDIERLSSTGYPDAKGSRGIANEEEAANDGACGVFSAGDDPEQSNYPTGVVASTVSSIGVAMAAITSGTCGVSAINNDRHCELAKEDALAFGFFTWSTVKGSRLVAFGLRSCVEKSGQKPFFSQQGFHEGGDIPRIVKISALIEGGLLFKIESGPSIVRFQWTPNCCALAVLLIALLVLGSLNLYGPKRD